MTLRCLIRKALVAATPEEEVRQRLLLYLTKEKGYPEELIAVEKALATMPHLLNEKKLPDRRADIVVFSRDPTSSILFPLLLIECKAAPFREEIFRQVIGYNHFVKAHLIALANRDSIQWGCFRAFQGWIFQEGVPSYREALNLASQD